MVDLQRYAIILSRRRRPAAAAGVLILVAATLVGLLRPPTFQSEAIIALKQQSELTPQATRPAAALILNEAFLTSAQDAVDLAGGLPQLRGMVRADPLGDTDLIRLRVTNPDARVAQAVAKAITDHFLTKWDQQNEPRRRLLLEQLEQVRGSLARVERLSATAAGVLQQVQQGDATRRADPSAIASAVQASAETEDIRERLQEAQRELQLELLTLTRAVIVEEPRVPPAPRSQSITLSLVLVVIVSLFGSIIAAFLIEMVQAVPRTQPSDAEPHV